MNNRWEPVQSTTKSPHDQQMDDYVARGCPVEHSLIDGLIGLAFTIVMYVLLPAAFMWFIVKGYACIIDIYCLTWLR